MLEYRTRCRLEQLKDILDEQIYIIGVMQGNADVSTSYAATTATEALLTQLQAAGTLVALLLVTL